MTFRLPALLALAALLVTGCSSAGTADPAAAPTVAATYHGLVPQEKAPRPDFILSTTDGTPYNFATETKGQPTYLYFGYTNCPDECPTAMADLASALRTVDPALRAKAKVVFVTTDPTRDTPAVLRSWLDRFDPSFIALTGTQAQVDAAQRAANVPVAYREDVDDPAAEAGPDGGRARGPAPRRAPRPARRRPVRAPAGGGYSVAHSAALIAYGTQDRVEVLYLAGAAPEDYALDLPVLAGSR